MSETSFGKYLREMRIAAKRSLREVADLLGVTHVYLGEVERGIRGPMKMERWPDLAKAIPGITVDQLQHHADRSKPLQLNVQDAPTQYQDLSLALARRMEKLDISKADLKKLFKILGHDDE